MPRAAPQRLPVPTDPMRHPTAARTPARVPAAVNVSPLRSIVEALVFLALAVVLFRTFEVEGYMISTGSMAPCLLGYHKRVTCPSCGCQFAFGAAKDDSEPVEVVHPSPRGPAADLLAADPAAGNSALGTHPEFEATCPNCGRTSIDTSAIPLNQGDQLLVSKNAYLLGPPRRWEVTVFRNPTRPTQAYVKRIVGLPSEVVEIRDGDVYVDGLIQRKKLPQQYGTRILVYDHDHEPADDPAWQARWSPQPAAPPWTASGRGFDVAPARTEAPETAWLDYRHWVREGGLHKTSVPLERLPDGVDTADLMWGPVRFDAAARRLESAGVMSPRTRYRLLALSNTPDFTRAVGDLYQESRLAPVTDTYGYNPATGGIPSVPVRDLMLSFDLRLGDGDGDLMVQMTDGDKNFECVVSAKDASITLFEDEAKVPVRSAKIAGTLRGRTMRFEMSLFDRQLLVAIDGEPVFEEWPFMSRAASEPPRRPVRIGARGVSARVESLRLYRDVYYTQKGTQTEQHLGSDEYFVMGDNSPVSFDSRCWPSGAVSNRLLLGKPFIVHLPSRPGKIEIGGRAIYIRIPDVSRIRYIR